jgi:hypothetical protein
VEDEEMWQVILKWSEDFTLKEEELDGDYTCL